MKKFISLSAGFFWFMIIYVTIEIINKYWWDKLESYALGSILAWLILTFFEKRMDKL